MTAQLPQHEGMTLVYVSTDGATVYDLAAQEVPSDPTERHRLRVSLIESLRVIADVEHPEGAAHPPL